MVLNYNGAGLLANYLPTILSCGYPSAKIYVADNLSTDHSAEIVRQQFPDVVWMQNGWNAGYAAGYNQALQQIDADLYLLINSDVKVTPGFLQPLVQCILREPTAAAVQPKILWEREPDKFEYAGACGGYIDSLGYPFCRGRILEQLETDTGQYDAPAKVFWTSGACMLVKAEAFHKAGGFFNYFFMHQEEIDLCWRLQLAGYSCHVVPESVVYHLGAATLLATNSRKTYFNFRNNLVMLARNMPAGRMLWLMPLRLLLDGLAAMHYLVRGQVSHAFAIGKAWISFLFWIMRSGKATANRKPVKALPEMYKGSLLWQFYAGGKKTWSDMMK